MSAAVLVVGVPRSGTTWVAQTLAQSAGATYLEEPDNHLRFAFAFRAKHRLGSRAYPQLAQSASGPELDDYEELWRHAFAPSPAERTRGTLAALANRVVARAGPKRVSSALEQPLRRHPALGAAARLAAPECPVPGADLVVKSVYAPLAAEWIVSRHRVEVVSVLRSPLNILSSWIELDWLPPSGPDALSTLDPAIADELAERFEAPEPPRSTLARAAWLIGVLTCALDEATRRNDTWVRVVHEDACVAPGESFPPIAAAVGLTWSDAGDRALAAANRPGRGYETARVAAEARDAWRRRLDDAQVREIRSVLDRLPLDLGS